MPPQVFCESLEEGELIDKSVTEFTPPDDTSSSSMHFGAKALLPLAAASTVLPSVRHGVLSSRADQAEDPRRDAQGGCGEQSPRGEGQISFPQVKEGSNSNSREIRFLEGDGSCVGRPKGTGLSMLWQSPANASGQRIFEWEEQIRNVDGMRTLPAQNRIHPSVRSDRDLQAGRSTASTYAP